MLNQERMGTLRFWPCIGLLLGLLGGGSPPVSWAQEAVIEDGLFITVPNPITSEGVNTIMNKVRDARKPGHQLKHVVFDFNPDNLPAGTSSYGPCHDLADYILGLHDVITIAFVRNDVTRHTVLPVLACQDLVMAPQARLGDVLGLKEDPQAQPAPLKQDQELFYKQVTRNQAHWAIVRKMLNRNLEVLEGRSKKANSVWYVVRGEEMAEEVRVVQPAAVLRAGEIGLLTANQARAFGLCKLFRDNRQQVKDAYGMPVSSLREDQLGGRTPIAYRVVVSGPISKALDESLRRRIRKVIGKGANRLILEFRNCGGGDTIVARDLADFLRTLKDSSGQHPIQTIAYVAEKAPDTATFLALGCGEIVMGPQGELGDFQNFLTEMKGGQRVPLEGPPEALMKSLQGLAKEQGYSPLLAQGMLDRRLTILEVHSTPGNPPEKRLITQQEWDEDHQPGRQPYWQNQQIRKADGQLLVLNATLARDLGVARHVADNLNKVYDLYGMKPEQVRQADPDWLDEIAAFLRQGWVASVLVMIGIMFLILEIKLPGVGLPGVISALAFVLFFWAHSSQLSGQITMLAILLFLLGLAFMALEIFLLPGFGVAGVSGILLVLVSLGLVTLEKKPETSQEWWGFANTLTTLGFCIIAATIGAFLLGRYLHNIPYFNRLTPPPPTEELATAGEASYSGETAALLGAIGEAATSLRPAGMARFGDDYVDVVSDGSYIAAGARIQVIEIEGNRIVVKEV
jgi:membrane-bound serine protease (ClpP class)